MDKQNKNLQNPVGSIVFYTDYRKYLGYLSGDEIKTLLNLIFDCVENYDFQNPQNPVGFDDATPMTQVVFDVIMGQFKRDKAKYGQRANASRENGKRGGRPRKNLENPAKPSDNLEKPKKPVNDKCNNVTMINAKGKEITPPQTVIENNPRVCAGAAGDFPTLSDVESFVAFRNSPVNAKEFYDAYANTTPPWTDKQGRKISDWRRLLIAWEKKYLTVYEETEDKSETKLGSVSKIVL